MTRSTTPTSAGVSVALATRAWGQGGRVRTRQKTQPCRWLMLLAHRRVAADGRDAYAPALDSLLVCAPADAVDLDPGRVCQSRGQVPAHPACSNHSHAVGRRSGCHCHAGLSTVTSALWRMKVVSG
jgi:hypothetical protein